MISSRVLRIGFLLLFRGKQPIFSLFLVHFFGFFRGYDDFVQFRTKSTEYFYSLGKKSKKNWLFLKNPRKKPISRLYAPKMCWNCTESNVFGAFLPWLLGEYADFIQLSGKIRVFCRQIMGKNQKSRNFRYPKVSKVSCGTI